jgi:hypothetical protein
VALEGGMHADRLDLRLHLTIYRRQPADAKPGEPLLRRDGDKIEVGAVLGHGERLAPPRDGHVLAAEGRAVQRDVALHLVDPGERPDGKAGWYLGGRHRGGERLGQVMLTPLVAFEAHRLKQRLALGIAIGGIDEDQARAAARRDRAPALDAPRQCLAL